MDPLVSVIMPVYKARGTLCQAVSSVLKQSFQDFELILVDDNCPVNSCESVENFVNDSRIILLKNKRNEGVARARNLAIEASKGRYLSFLDADDIWLPNKLEDQLTILEKGYGLVYSNYIEFDGSGDKHIVKSPKEISYKDMLKKNHIGNLTGIYDTQRTGKIYQKPIGHEDYLMWLQILDKVGNAKSTESIVAKYRLGNHSLSSNKITASKWQWKVYREELSLGLLQSTYYLSNYAILSALKSLSRSMPWISLDSKN